MRRLSACVTTLILASVALAAPPTLGIPDELKPIGDYCIFSPGADSTAKAITYVGLSNVEPLPSMILADKRAFVLPTRGLANGKYRFRAVGSLNDEHASREFSVVIGGVLPPPSPIPPDPTPPPVPVPALGFRVLFIEETGANMNAEQLNTLNSTRIKDYLNRKTVKDSNGRAGWRKWDQHIDTAHELELWRNLWASVKPQVTTLPAVVIVTDQKATVYPLPATEEQTLTLLKSIGGE